MLRRIKLEIEPKYYQQLLPQTHRRITVALKKQQPPMQLLSMLLSIYLHLVREHSTSS